VAGGEVTWLTLYGILYTLAYAAPCSVIIYEAALKCTEAFVAVINATGFDGTL
jgi:hypothetical protein